MPSACGGVKNFAKFGIESGRRKANEIMTLRCGTRGFARSGSRARNRHIATVSKLEGELLKRHKRAVVARQVDSLVLSPTPERRAHGPVERAEVIIDAHDQRGRPWVGLDTLARMERAGSIGPDERKAGNTFARHFRLAHFDHLFAADPARTPVILIYSPANGHEREGNERARRLVYGAIDVLGGINSPAGSCVWHCLGCEASLTRWCLMWRWSGRAIRQTEAAGVIITALAILKRYYGLSHQT
jgi:hypothetical protein